MTPTSDAPGSGAAPVQCAAGIRRPPIGIIVHCTLDRGHDGPHANSFGDRWTEAGFLPEEPPQRLAETPGRQYAERDHEELGEWYFRHLDAMTREGLHDKSEIAAELAWRDRELAAAKAEADTLAERLAAAEAIVAKLPKTADGVPVIPGIDRVWGRVFGHRGIVELEIVSAVDCGMWATFDGNDRTYVASCYSTKAAALAAKVPPPADARATQGAKLTTPNPEGEAKP